MSKNLSEYQFDGIDARDEFNRKPIAEKIIKLLTSDIDLSPMIIDGDWGTGKSEFCHKLMNKFSAENTDVQILHIDAFQADHADNPLMTIIAEIMKLLPDEPKRKGFLKKALPVIRYGTKAILKAGVNHVMRESVENIADGLEKEIQEAANTAIDATVTAILKDHEEAEKNLNALKILLAELAKDKPIIIFIDELDRCRPDYSVHMLEVIKHTFNVKNVKFVLVTNTVQLRAAINHAYGATINADRYLDKFINFTIKLPEKVLTEEFAEFQLASSKYFEELVKKSTILQETRFNPMNTRRSTISHLVGNLIRVNNLSLREVETFKRHLEMAIILNVRMDNNIAEGNILLAILAIFIDCFKSDLSNDIKNDQSDAIDILNLVGVDFGNKDISKSMYGSNALVVLLSSMAHKNSDHIVQFLTTSSTNYEDWYWGIEYFVPQNYFQIIKSVIDKIHFR